MVFMDLEDKLIIGMLFIALFLGGILLMYVPEDKRAWDNTSKPVNQSVLPGNLITRPSPATVSSPQSGSSSPLEDECVRLCGLKADSYLSVTQKQGYWYCTCKGGYAKYLSKV